MNNDKNTSVIRKWLADIGLDEYIDSFLSQKYTEINVIAEMNDDDINEMIRDIGIRGTHKIKVKKAIGSIARELAPGSFIEAKFEDGHFYNAQIKEKSKNGYIVNYYEFGEEYEVTVDKIKVKIKARKDDAYAPVFITEDEKELVPGATRDDPGAYAPVVISDDDIGDQYEYIDIGNEIDDTGNAYDGGRNPDAYAPVIISDDELVDSSGYESGTLTMPDDSVSIKNPYNGQVLVDTTIPKIDTPNPKVHALTKNPYGQTVEVEVPRGLDKNPYKSSNFENGDPNIDTDIVNPYDRTLSADTQLDLERPNPYNQQNQTEEKEFISQSLEEWLESMGMRHQLTNFIDNDYDDYDSIANMNPTQIGNMITVLDLTEDEAQSIRVSLTKTEDIVNTKELEEWLTSINVPVKTYGPKLTKNGYTDLSRIKMFNIQQIEEMIQAIGCKRGSAEKIRIGLKKKKPIARDSQEIEKWLVSIKLAKYTQAFKDNGYTDLAAIKKFDESQLDELSRKVGLRSGSKEKLKTWIAGKNNIKNNNKIKEVESMPIETSKEFDEVKKWLEEAKMEKYVNDFFQHNYRSLAQFKSLTDHGKKKLIEKVGMKAGSILKLDKALLSLQETQKTQKITKVNIKTEQMPSGYTLPHGAKDLTGEFTFKGKCSFRTTVSRIKTGQTRRLPPEFYILSSSTNKYYRFIIAYKDS